MLKILDLFYFYTQLKGWLTVLDLLRQLFKGAHWL